ncbi:MAG TPA: AAA family ATPase [Candidatus Saccharimonadales bacterium]|nr:AAA family ATPase [Candidatus Saccharimonadales bacterium]
MALYYVFGISGSGKSTVLAELRKRGFEAYDVDEAGPATAKWHNDTTGFVHPKSSVKVANRTPEFLAQHSWKVPRTEVAELAKAAHGKVVFLGGAINNMPDLEDIFDAVFALAIDDETLKHRLATRTSNDWGKLPHELEHTLVNNQWLAKRYPDSGYLVIDASQPIDAVINEILHHVDEN